MLYMVEGVDLRVGFVEENGGDGTVVNDMSTGDLSFVPQGLVHYQQNLGCEPATILMSLNSDDPGEVVLSSVLFALPTELLGVRASVLNIVSSLVTMDYIMAMTLSSTTTTYEEKQQERQLITI